MIGTVHMSINTLQLPKTYPEVKLNWISGFKRSKDIIITEVFRIHSGATLVLRENIDKNLKRISKIPKIKERISFIKDNAPKFLKSFLA